VHLYVINLKKSNLSQKKHIFLAFRYSFIFSFTCSLCLIICLFHYNMIRLIYFSIFVNYKHTKKTLVTNDSNLFSVLEWDFLLFYYNLFYYKFVMKVLSKKVADQITQKKRQVIYSIWVMQHTLLTITL
jgi:hypothetical protein